MASFGRYVQITLEREEVSLDLGSPIDTGFPSNYVATASSVATTTERTVQRKLSSELKCTFDFKTSSKGITGSVKVYNLAEESREFPFGGSNGVDGAVIIIDAGYDDNHGVILRSSIADINEYSSGSDSITEYTIGSPSTRFDKNSASISIQSQTNLYDILLDSLDRAGVDYVNELQDRYDSGAASLAVTELHNFAFHGTVADLFNAKLPHIYSMEYGIPILVVPLHHRPQTLEEWQLGIEPAKKWTMGSIVHVAKFHKDQLGFVRLFWDDAPRILSDIVNISSETGIISVPIKKSKKKKRLTEVKHILIPQLVKSAIVRIKTSGKYGKLKDGDYKISEIKYKGSNYTGKHEVIMGLNSAPKKEGVIEHER